MKHQSFPRCQDHRCQGVCREAAIRSDLSVAINKALAEKGIEIPFPQRDLHLRSISPGARVELVVVDRGRPTMRTVNPWMGDYGQEFMDAGPWYCPGGTSFGEFNHADVGGIMPGRVFPVGANKNIAVYCDQPPRPS
jgi:hypothetical protein